MSTEVEIVESDDITIAEGGIAEGSSRDYDQVWDSLQALVQSRENISAMVVDAVKGGLVVDLGVRGFIPKSQIATRNMSNLDRYIGQTVEAKVVEVDRDKQRVVLSERQAVEEKRRAQRAETLKSLEVGMEIDGVVCRLTDFGAFVDIGGVDGLLHISDMAWDHVDKPSDIVSEGQPLRVKVLRIEKDGERISLGLKQFQEDPWNLVRRDVREGSLIEVTITAITPGGAVAAIMPGIEGFIPNEEYQPRRRDGEGNEAAVILQPEQTVTVKVLELRHRERRAVLSLKQALRERERQEVREYMKRQQADVTPTLGDLFGDVFSKLKK